MVNAPSVSLKVVVVVHFVLSVWGSMALPVAYAYMNAFILAFGFWAIAAPESVESVFMFMILDLVGILLDVIILAVFGYHMTEEGVTWQRSLGKFSLAMASINVIARPLASFVLYRLYQDRGGQYSDFGIPGMPHFGGSEDGRQGHGYENIDQPIPSNTVETASPHHSIDGKSPIP